MTTTKPQSTTEPPDRIWISSDRALKWTDYAFDGGVEYQRVPASAAPAVDNELRNAFLQAAVEAHVGFQHPLKWEDCDMAICGERKRLINPSSAVPEPDDDAQREQAFREFWGERDRNRPFDYAHPERYSTFTKRYAPPAADTAAPVERSVYVSEHPVTLHCNTCGLVQVKSFKCPRGDGQLVAGAGSVEQNVFKNTKEAMLYAQRNNIPAVVPVEELGDKQIDEATMEWALRELADGWITNNEREGPHGFYQNARRVLEAIVS